MSFRALAQDESGPFETQPDSSLRGAMRVSHAIPAFCTAYCKLQRRDPSPSIEPLKDNALPPRARGIAVAIDEVGDEQDSRRSRRME